MPLLFCKFAKNTSPIMENKLAHVLERNGHAR